MVRETLDSCESSVFSVVVSAVSVMTSRYRGIRDTGQNRGNKIRDDITLVLLLPMLTYYHGVSKALALLKPRCYYCDGSNRTMVLLKPW